MPFMSAIIALFFRWTTRCEIGQAENDRGKLKFWKTVSIQVKIFYKSMWREPK